MLLPLGYAAGRSALGDWLPVGDSAYFTARSFDVGGPHTPLIGAWSSGSVEYARPVNSLGPLEMYVLAPFTRWTPDGGTAVGTAVIQAAAMVCIVWLVRRGFGRRSAIGAQIGVVWLCWVLGSENLIAAVQHPYLVLPFAAAIVATASVVVGDRWGLVPFVFFGVLCAQTHLTYVILIAWLTIVVSSAVVWQYRSADNPKTRSQWIRMGGWTAAFAGLLWLPPLLDQFFGRGNLAAAFSQRGGEQYQTGLRLGVRIVATVVTAPSRWTPDGYLGVLDDHIVSGARGAALLLAVVAASIGSVIAWRSGRRRLAAVVALLTSTLAVMMLDASLIPRTTFGYRVDNYRWLWSWLGVVAMATTIGVDGWLRQHAPRILDWPRTGPWVLTGIVALVSVVNFVPHGVANPAEYAATNAAVASLSEQLDAYLDEHPPTGPVLIDDAFLYFGVAYTYPIAVVMQSHGVDFRFLQPVWGYRFGPDRVVDGSETQALVVRVGEDAIERRSTAIAWADQLEPVVYIMEDLRPGDTLHPGPELWPAGGGDGG